MSLGSDSPFKVKFMKADRSGIAQKQRNLHELFVNIITGEVVSTSTDDRRVDTLKLWNMGLGHASEKAWLSWTRETCQKGWFRASWIYLSIVWSSKYSCLFNMEKWKILLTMSLQCSVLFAPSKWLSPRTCYFVTFIDGIPVKRTHILQHKAEAFLLSSCGKGSYGCIVKRQHVSATVMAGNINS